MLSAWASICDCRSYRKRSIGDFLGFVASEGNVQGPASSVPQIPIEMSVPFAALDIQKAYRCLLRLEALYRDHTFRDCNVI